MLLSAFNFRCFFYGEFNSNNFRNRLDERLGISSHVFSDSVLFSCNVLLVISIFLVERVITEFYLANCILLT